VSVGTLKGKVKQEFLFFWQEKAPSAGLATDEAGLLAGLVTL